MNKALALEVARELKISPEKASLVCKSFHDGLRELMSKPDEVKGGILISNFLTLKLKEFKLQQSIERLGVNYDVTLRQTIVDNLKRYKRNVNTVKKKQTEQ
jgi:hypothetical protein